MLREHETLGGTLARPDKARRDWQVYTGCLENQHGFYPLRDPKSKWFISYEEMPDSAVRRHPTPTATLTVPAGPRSTSSTLVARGMLVLKS